VCQRWETLSRHVSSAFKCPASTRTAAVDLNETGGQQDTSSGDIDEDRDNHHDKTWQLGISQPEGLFTELEAAMDATSSHLLAVETITDIPSTYDNTNIDRMVSLLVLLKLPKIR